MQTVGQYEDQIFQKRVRELKRQKDRLQRQRYQKEQDKKRRRDGHSLRADEMAPSASYVQASLAAGDIRSARSTARAPLQLSSTDVPPALAMDPSRPPGPLPPPSANGAGAEPSPARPDNKGAAARLRAGILGKPSAAASASPSSAPADVGAQAGEADGQGGNGSEEPPPTKLVRSQEDQDVSGAVPGAGAGASGAEDATPGPDGEGDGGDLSFAELQNMAPVEKMDDDEVSGGQQGVNWKCCWVCCCTVGCFD